MIRILSALRWPLFAVYVLAGGAAVMMATPIGLSALGLSLDAIADHVGMHVSTLQRHFRLQYGTSVVECARDARLLRARRALERDRVSVGQAAELAGYSSPANFATAYRRRFGVPPKWSRDGF